MKLKMKIFLLTLAALHSIVTVSMAAAPDLTAGGVPNEDPPHTFNLGPTGARGWAYHKSYFTTDSRQILVTRVDSGSPADGILAVDDVILGADGTGANPAAFNSDARKSLALAIAAAEARSPATLKLLRWRAGVTSTVTLTLQTMGAYSATAPYNCPKSAKILQDGLQYVYDNEDAGRYSFGGITLLVNGNPTYQARAQTYARGRVPSQATMDKMMSDQRDDSGGLPAWERGLTLIFLSEYYLATGDEQVKPAIEAYAVNIAKNSSLFGTLGHGFAYKKADGSHNGPLKDGYGAVNTPGLMAFLGISLAKECGLTNPEIDPAIERASRFFAYYSGKGTIPYGEHDPPARGHESNGKCGLAALVFMLQQDRVEEAKFFSKMSTASINKRERGHTGSFFNYLWAPLGAAVGGEEAASAHFKRISWMLDLNRCWDGRFQYDCLNGEGPRNGSSYHNFRMSTVALLNYALPLRKLYITGKGHDPNRWLSTEDVAEAIAAGDYIADNRSTSELIEDITNWSARVRKDAADELGTRSISVSEFKQVTDLATDTSGSSHSRAGACYALGQIGNPSSAPVLADLLTDPDNYVRYMAAEGMRYLPDVDRRVHLDKILTAADTTAQPLYPMVEEDPLHFAHGRLAALLFSKSSPRGIIYSSFDGVDRNLLYPAVRAVAENPIGKARSTLETPYTNLTFDDVLELSGTIIDSVVHAAPADIMFLKGVRLGGVDVLHQYGIAEGVPAGMIFADETNHGPRVKAFQRLGAYGGSVKTVMPDPHTVEFLESYLNDSTVGDTVYDILALIEADTNPTPLMHLKSIQSAAADEPIVTLPANSTTLRVSAFDHAKGHSIYTWEKLSGPGEVSFSHNGTADAANTTIVFDGTPGPYRFKVTMSDSRSLTEACETVWVQLAVPVEGDFNSDIKVDLLDLETLAKGWLSTYNMSHFALMSKDWLLNTTFYPVPDFVGMSQADAESAIVSAGNNVGQVTTVYSNTVAADIVISQSPAAGTITDTGLPVDIVVSLGAEPPRVIELLSRKSTQWHYRKGLSEPPYNWRQIDFTEDATWHVGQAPIGYSGRGEFTPMTVLSDMRNNYTTVYARHAFEVDTPEGYKLDTLTLRLFIDDGCIVSINNKELHRFNVSDGPKSYNDTSGLGYLNVSWVDVDISDISSVNEGTNILAIHGLNQAIGSSDLCIEAELNANFVSTGTE